VSYQVADDEDETPSAMPVFGPFLPSSVSKPSSLEPPAGPVVEPSSTTKTGADDKPKNKSEDGAKDDRFDEEIRKLKALHEKFQKRTQQLKTKDSDEAGKTTEPVSVPPVTTAETSKPAASLPEVGCCDVAKEETVQTSEDQVFVSFEYTNRRYDGDLVGPAEEMDVDVEDIDQQLEMALERHQVGVCLLIVVIVSVSLVLKLCS